MAPRPRVLIVGVSARAAAESAARAGFEVTALDAFADLDQHRGVRALSLPRDFGVRFSARAAAEVSRRFECDAVAYLSSFENHPAAVLALSAGRTLWGNSPRVLRRVRDPALVSAAFRRRGLPAPGVIPSGAPKARSRGIAVVPTEGLAPLPGGQRVLDSAGLRRASRGMTLATGRWLLKPRASGGGTRIREWNAGVPVPRGAYLQEFIEGTPGSVVFVAAGGRAVTLGVSRQLIGEPALGARGFRYCGSILDLTASVPSVSSAVDAVADPARALASAAAEAFDLVGVNCIDVVTRDGVPYPVEINPRWSASMELVERAYGLSMFGLHATACAERVLPAAEPRAAARGAGTLGKAIVFAMRDTTVGDTGDWLADPSVRDVPHPGELIPAGRPICTVYAGGDDAVACRRALIERANRIYAKLRQPEAIHA